MTTPEVKAAAKRLLKTIDGIHCGAEVQPGKVIRTSDVILVCQALQALMTCPDCNGTGKSGLANHRTRPHQPGKP